MFAVRYLLAVQFVLPVHFLLPVRSGVCIVQQRLPRRELLGWIGWIGWSRSG